MHLPKGEIVLLIAPPNGTLSGDMDTDEMLRDALADMKPSQAAGMVAKVSGKDRKLLYARALELRSS